MEYTGTWLIPHRAGISNRQEVVLGGKTSGKCGITFSRLRGFAFEGNESRHARTMNFQIYFSRERSVPRHNLIPRFPLIFTRTTTSCRSFGAAISHVLPYSTNLRARPARRPRTRISLRAFPAFSRGQSARCCFRATADLQLGRDAR